MALDAAGGTPNLAFLPAGPVAPLEALEASSPLLLFLLDLLACLCLAWGASAAQLTAATYSEASRVFKLSALMTSVEAAAFLTSPQAGFSSAAKAKVVSSTHFWEGAVT